MKIIFFGTPDYVVSIVDALYKEYRTIKDKGVIAVVTQPPKPAGRDKKIEYSAVDTWAYKKDIRILRDLDMRSSDTGKNLPEADLGVVAAYGKIIPKEIISHFKFGILNIHPSLLPKYRGASPTQAAIAAGETTTGVTVIKMDEKMDHGPVVSSLKEEIRPDDTNETLRKRLFERAAQFLIDLIPNYLNGKIKLKEQNHAKATFTKMVKRENGFVLLKALKKDPEGTERKFRAYQPWPGIYTNVNIKGEQKRLKILKLHLEDGRLVIDQVQLEGKNPVTWEGFKKGHPNFNSRMAM